MKKFREVRQEGRDRETTKGERVSVHASASPFTQDLSGCVAVCLVSVAAFPKTLHTHC